MFTNKRILITGGTGSWANELTTQLLSKYQPEEIILFSRGELQQVYMQRRYNNPKLKFMIGDVRDYDAIFRATKDINYVFHMAALKHVPICEEHGQEAIKTNINGTINVINASIENGVEKVIDLSSDKAVEPINLYGQTKAVGEKLIIQANNLSLKTKFVCIRGGNVMGSNGSVIPFFIEQIKAKRPVTITDMRMTRYFLTLNEAIGLLFKASNNGIGGEIFVMNMPSCYLKNLVEILMEVYGKTEIKEIGIRPGEKLDETLISKHESRSSFVYDENYYVILPELQINHIEKHYSTLNLQKVPFDEFTSKTIIMKNQDIYNMLKKGNFIP